MLLNLDPTFKPYGEGLDVKSWIFNAGEIGIKISQYATKYLKFHSNDHKIIITARLINSDKIMELLMTTDALKRMGFKDIEAHIFYLPYARQDRVMVEGESLSLRVFADLINSQGYSRVVIFDQHSDVSTALLNNVVNISNHKFVREVLKGKKDYWLVSVDGGSLKKIYGLAKYLSKNNDSYYGVVLCNKQRDVATGEITRIDVSRDDLNGFDCYIPDDIGDGFRSFIELAKELRKRNCGKIYVIVSHGIYSKGYDLEGIEHTFTTNSFKDIDHPKVTQIKLDSSFLS